MVSFLVNVVLDPALRSKTCLTINVNSPETDAKSINIANNVHNKAPVSARIRVKRNYGSLGTDSGIPVTSFQEAKSSS